MDAHIDWVSFVLPIGQGASIVSFADFLREYDYALLEIGKQHYDYVHAGQHFNPQVGRAPYRYQVARDDRGARVFGGGPNKTILFELTGRACEGLRRTQDYKPFLSPLVGCVTRIDIAVDIRCDTAPSAFCNHRDGARFKSLGFQRSETGETVYIGSRTSDRFARVYRYFAPHPRHEYLRVEFVFRKQLAKAAAASLSTQASLPEFVSSAGETFGFIHPDWNPAVKDAEKLRVPITTRETDGTVAWLYRSVAPAIRRSIENGGLDWDDWVRFVWNGDDEPGP